MRQTKRFAVVGSDARQAAAGRALARAGYTVGGVQQLPQADCILLPLPLEQSGLPLAQLLGMAKPGALALGGKVTDSARTIARAAGVELVDYFARPELTVYNAIPTAEGCIGILLERRSRTLCAVFRARFHPEWTGFAQNPLLFSRVFSVFVRYRDFTISLSAHQASSPT